MIDSSILTRNNVKVWGNGTQTMMFAHGFGCDQNMWRFITPAFENDYRIIAFDYVGGGKSDISAYNEDRYNNLNGYADDVLEICQALKLKNIIFVGHSVSCMIGLVASNRDPSLFAQLIFISPSPRYINDGNGYIGGFEKTDIEELLDTMDKNYIGWSNFLAPIIMQNPEKPELVQELAERFCSTDPRIARKFAEVTFLADNRNDLKNIKVPSLIMQCTEDLIAPLAVGLYMHKNTPLSTLQVLKANGHCPHMSHPKETTDIIKTYLNSQHNQQLL